MHGDYNGQRAGRKCNDECTALKLEHRLKKDRTKCGNAADGRTCIAVKPALLLAGNAEIGTGRTVERQSEEIRGLTAVWTFTHEILPNVKDEPRHELA